MIKSIISDLGKVIIAFDNFIFYHKISEYSPLSKEEIFNQIIKNLELSRDFDRGRVTPEAFYSRAKEILQVEVDRATFFSIYNDIFAFDPSVLEVYKSLRMKYRLVLCSNTDVERFGFIKARFPEILIFDSYVLSYEVGHMKPDPQIYLSAINEAKAEAEECLFIDDREENIVAARQLGIQTILFSPETDLKMELKKRGVGS